MLLLRLHLTHCQGPPHETFVGHACKAPRHVLPHVNSPDISQHVVSLCFIVLRYSVHVDDAVGTKAGKMNVQRSGSSAYWDSDAWNPDDRVYVGASDGQTYLSLN